METESGNTPFTADVINRALVRPDVAIDVVLASPTRFGATLSTPLRRRLALTTSVVAVLFALPFGLYFGLAKAFHVAALFVGSVLVCYPSLHVFTAYVGIPLRVGQSAALAMLAAAVASTFSLGFAPVVFFLRATIADAAEARSMGPIASRLLCLALVAGMLQVVRCLRSGTLGSQTTSFGVVLVGWFLLLGFIALRMARVLGIDG